MQYNIDIKDHNVQAHTDIEHDIEKQQNGLLTFILRIDNGNIVDYNVIECVDIKDYIKLETILIREVNLLK